MLNFNWQSSGSGAPIVTLILLRILKVKHFQLCLVYNLDHIDSDDDGDNDRLALSSVLPNASLCLDCGAYEDCTDTICIQKILLYYLFYIYVLIALLAELTLLLHVLIALLAK